jgi:hypothetical protein
VSVPLLVVLMWKCVYLIDSNIELFDWISYNVEVCLLGRF